MSEGAFSPAPAYHRGLLWGGLKKYQLREPDRPTAALLGSRRASLLGVRLRAPLGGASENSPMP